MHPRRLPLLVLARKARPFVAPFRSGLLFTFLLAASVAAISALEPLVLKHLFDALSAGAGVDSIARATLFLLGLLVIQQGLNAMLDYVVWKIRVGINFRMTRATIERIQTLPLAFHRKHPVGELMTKIERGISGSVTAFSTTAFQVLPAIVYLVVAIVVMLRLEWRLGLIVLAFAPVPAIIGALAAPMQVARERGLFALWTRVFARFNEVLAGIDVVKCFAREDTEMNRFLRRVRGANRVVLRGVAADAAVEATKNTVVAVARVVAIGVGAYLISVGRIQLGTLVAFLGYIGGVFQPVQSLTGAYQTVRRGTVALETVFSILDESDTMADAPNARDAGKLRGEVEFRDVSFGYRDGDAVLDRVSLSVAAGEVVAIVGPSGGGKTTLMALLQRLYDPTSGSIHVDGADLRGLQQQSLRRQIGVVLQEGLLFSETLRANIAFGRPGATHEEVENVARAAYADGFITRLPRGYETRVGAGGGTLSGGERQRVAIARALLKDAPILILDEATSALDAESEAEVQRALIALTQGRTTFIIAHRLATIVRADRIIVLKDGKLAESGRHSELVARGGYYASLVRHQIAGLLVDEAA